MVTLSKCRSILTLFDVLTKLKTDYLSDWRRFCKFDAQKALKRAKTRLKSRPEITDNTPPHG